MDNEVQDTVSGCAGIIIIIGAFLTGALVGTIATLFICGVLK
jgi:hypothetical protein